MRTLVTLLSILLLWVFGALGEELLNWLHVHCEQCGDSLPMLTAFFYKNYGLNTGTFSLSLTPFALMFLGVLLVSLAKRSSTEKFLYAFITVWLLAGLYLAVFCFSVLLPFQLLLREVGDHRAPRVILTVDAVLLVVIVVLCGHCLWKRGKSAQATAPDAAKLTQSELGCLERFVAGTGYGVFAANRMSLYKKMKRYGIEMAESVA